jgi:hypothetical protein
MHTRPTSNRRPPPSISSPPPSDAIGFTSIGAGMMSLTNLGLGLGLFEYGNACHLGFQVGGASAE